MRYEDAGNCLRCGRKLTPRICDEEFLETGICADCWKPEVAKFVM